MRLGAELLRRRRAGESVAALAVAYRLHKGRIRFLVKLAQEDEKVRFGLCSGDGKNQPEARP